MITCQKCAHVNPMGTVFCHSCGTRLQITTNTVAKSVELTKQTQLDHTIFLIGRNGLSLAVFVLAVALILKYVMVPRMPEADLPQPTELALFSKEPPAWAEAASKPATTQTTTLATGATTRLGWRQQQGASLLGSFGIDLGRVKEWQNAIIAAQKPDGSFPGGDSAAATALAALALQAYPSSDTVTAAAAKARATLVPIARQSSSAKSTLTRTLVVLALADAEELEEKIPLVLGVRMVDGSEPFWQAYSLPVYKDKDRPKELLSLKTKLTSPLWNAYFQLFDGKPQTLDGSAFTAKAAQNLGKGEERMIWALTSWLVPAAPKDYAATLKAWSGGDPIAADPALVKACGTTTATAVALLAVTAPLRVPVLAVCPSP